MDEGTFVVPFYNTDGWQGHMKDGHRVLYRDYIRTPTKVLKGDRCPFGVPDEIDRDSYEIHMPSCPLMCICIYIYIHTEIFIHMFLC